MVGFRRQLFRNTQCRARIGGRRRQPLQVRATVGRGSSWLLFDAVAFVAGPKPWKRPGERHMGYVFLFCGAQ